MTLMHATELGKKASVINFFKKNKIKQHLHGHGWIQMLRQEDVKLSNQRGRPKNNSWKDIHSIFRPS